MKLNLRSIIQRYDQIADPQWKLYRQFGSKHRPVPCSALVPGEYCPAARRPAIRNAVAQWRAPLPVASNSGNLGPPGRLPITSEGPGRRRLSGSPAWAAPDMEPFGECILVDPGAAQS